MVPGINIFSSTGSFPLKPREKKKGKDQLVAEHISKLLAEKIPEYPELLRQEESQAAADRKLVSEGKIGETELLNLYCDETELSPYDAKLLNPPAAIEGFSSSYLTAHRILPLEMTDSGLHIVFSDPYEMTEQCRVLETLFKRKVACELASSSIVERLISSLYTEQTARPDEKEKEEITSEEEELRRLAGETGIVRLVNDMLTRAVELGVSDIHIEPDEKEFVVRFRIDGIISDHIKLPASDYPAVASRIKLVGGLNIAERRLPQDGRTNFQIGGREMDIRISTIPVMNGESIVLRLLSKDNTRFDLRELGMNAEMLPQFEKLIALPHGILLVVGPTGSGKTTTLYSVMRSLNNRHRKIITIEDPVEYQLPGLSQMQVNPKIGLTFANGLRHIVRQDPDVILVGEIRDRETADIAINAALTGHLVLSTLHTNDAVGAIVRLLDMGVEPFLITASLCGVLSQRLIRVTCTACGGTGKSGGQPCRACGGSGFRGRSGIFELLCMDDEIREAVHRSAAVGEIEAIARKNGMKTLLEYGLQRVNKGETTRAELLRSVSGMLEGEQSL